MSNTVKTLTNITTDELLERYLEENKARIHTYTVMRNIAISVAVISGTIATVGILKSILSK